MTKIPSTSKKIHRLRYRNGQLTCSSISQHSILNNNVIRIPQTYIHNTLCLIPHLECQWGLRVQITIHYSPLHLVAVYQHCLIYGNLEIQAKTQWWQWHECKIRAQRLLLVKHTINGDITSIISWSPILLILISYGHMKKHVPWCFQSVHKNGCHIKLYDFNNRAPFETPLQVFLDSYLC